MSNNDNSVENGLTIHGTCMELCPTEEVTLRMKEKLVHVLEVTSSGHKLVKSFCRSAANSNLAVPRMLRPFGVLSDTVHYLLLELSNRTDVKMSVLYDFLDDRLRAVRQDMTIQRLPPEQCVILLEPMIRFYVYYGYRLYNHPISEYDPVLNRKHLLECIKWFLNCCDKLDSTQTVQCDINTIIGNFNSLDICKTSPELYYDRILIESLYILSNLDDIHPLHRYLALPGHVKKASALKLAYYIALANMNNNYVRVLKLSKHLCPLTFSVLSLYLPTLQRKALHAMSHAYNSKHLVVPVEVLKQWLAFNTLEEVRAICIHYGMSLVREKDGICFEKAKFKNNVEQHRQLCFQAKILQLKLDEVLSYTI
ncbi:SAC3 domain-containing protein 1 [Bicyclus anynana]|uniref:SAC3 domain-containing protein 1 n=1 Tax=Bicyclus anynana TaxID=110368 RepID=A0ABM3LFJ4_BICAN|nr:SAC3 domain-containing protein 1 [Bicyclus anynana]